MRTEKSTGCARIIPEGFWSKDIASRHSKYWCTGWVHCVREQHYPGLRHSAINRTVVGPLGLSEQPICHRMAHQDMAFSRLTHCSNTSTLTVGLVAASDFVMMLKLLSYQHLLLCRLAMISPSFSQRCCR